MKYLKTLILVALVAVFAACNKNNDGSGTVADMPANITLASVVSTDNSGNVTFTAAADNAASYEFDFGNGVFQTSTTGNVTYQYPVAGTYTVKITVKSASGKKATKSAQVTVSAIEALVWSDEFNTPGAPDPAKWGYDLGGGGWGNNEVQYYTNRSSNNIVSNGTLKITTQRENFSGATFTSSRLLTKNKFQFTYGKIEVRAKLPSGGGSWPAIWMLGSSIDTTPWPACGEIDIMEHVGNQQNKIFSTLHYPNHSGGNGVSQSTMINTASTDFHVYSLEWNAATLKFAVDGVVFHTFPNNNTTPFNSNFFVILNVAVGGNFGGAVDPNFNGGTMEVDYVRVYR